MSTTNVIQYKQGLLDLDKIRAKYIALGFNEEYESEEEEWHNAKMDTLWYSLTQDELNDMNKTIVIDQLVNEVVDGLKEENVGDIEIIQSMPVHKMVTALHHSLGRNIRNEWFWIDSPQKQYFKAIGINHPDHMSSIILEAVWYKLNYKVYDIDEAVERYISC